MTHARVQVREFDPAAGDPVLGCLMALARRYHHLVDEDILTAGLIFEPNGRLPRTQIPRVAARAGFTVNERQLPLSDIESAHLPALLFLADGEACVLIARRNGSCELLLPDLPAPTVVPSVALANRYDGTLMTLRARERATDGEHYPPPKPAIPWRVYLPLAMAAIPGDLIALIISAVLPQVSTHWGAGPRTVATAAALAVLVEGFLRLLRTHMLDHASHSLEGSLAGHLFRQLLGRPRPGSAGAFAVALQAFEGERSSLLRAVVAATAELPLFLALIGFLAWLGGPLVVPQLIALPAFLVLGLALEPATERAARRRTRDEAKRHGLLVEALSRTDTIRALGLDSRLQTDWTERSMTAARSAARARLTEFLVRGVTSALQAMVLVGIGAWGARLVEANQMQAATLAVCLLLSARIVAHMADVTHLLAHHRKAVGTLEGLRDLPRAPVEKPRSEPHFCRPTLREAIVFQDVTFRYGVRPAPALDRLNLRISAGERLGVVGNPGAGKTTLARLMLGLYRPGLGQVTIDGMRPASDQARIQPLFAYAPQDPFLFNGTLRDNLCLGLARPDEETLRRVAELAGIDALIDRVGLDGAVGEHGEFLSLGERQGISLARALLADASILLLDEPCSAWADDALGGLASRLVKVLAGHTLILISHRRPLLAMAERLVRLDSGRVVGTV